MKKATALILGGLAALVMGCAGDKFSVEVSAGPGSQENVTVDCKFLPEKGTLYITLPDGTHARYDVGQGYIWQNPPPNGKEIIEKCLEGYPVVRADIVYKSQI
jgi:hypothetical protein